MNGRKSAADVTAQYLIMHRALGDVIRRASCGGTRAEKLASSIKAVSRHTRLSTAGSSVTLSSPEWLSRE